MGKRIRFGAFLEAAYTDRRLKTRLIVWTFVVLAIPGALLLALGVRDVLVLPTVVALILPLQVLIYAVTSSHQTEKFISIRPNWIARAGEQSKSGELAASFAMPLFYLTHPDIEATTILSLVGQSRSEPSYVSWAELDAHLQTKQLVQGASQPQPEAELLSQAERQRHLVQEGLPSLAGAMHGTRPGIVGISAA